MFKRSTAVFLLVSLPFLAHAQSADTPLGLKEFEAYADILPVAPDGSSAPKRKSSDKPDIIPYIKSNIQDNAANIIKSPEQVFCYRVAKRSANLNEYTLDNFALKGYCGELDIGKTATTYEALFTRGPNIITSQSSCRIEPRVMLRFVRGVDFVDLLLSSPCPSFTVFYAGKYRSFNIKQAVIEDIIKLHEKTDEPFHSPALLKQTVANAKAETTADQEMIDKKQKELNPFLEMQNPEEKTPDVSTSSSSSKSSSGWGRLNLRLKNK